MAKEILSPEEISAIEKFRILMKDEIPPDLANDPTLYYRFMRARDFKIHQAEVMLRKHMGWREKNKIATYLEDYEPLEVLEKYLPQNFIGYDKEGCPVRYTVPGKMDIKGLFKSATQSEILANTLYVVETDSHLLKQQSKKLGRDVSQVIYLYDLSEMTFAKATNKRGTELLISFIKMVQDNYPERAKYLYVFNAPPFLTAIFAIISRFMAPRLLRKIRYFGTERWKESLLEVIDADVLPAFLGGNRTDPDGNPLCLTFVNHGGIIPEHYHRKSAQKILNRMPSAQKLTVNARSKVEVSVIVEEAGSFLKWEFQTLNQDIGFGIFFRGNAEDSECTTILPAERKNLDGEPIKGIHKCANDGTYILLFDNSYSWLNSKEIYYQATVITPADENEIPE